MRTSQGGIGARSARPSSWRIATSGERCDDSTFATRRLPVAGSRPMQSVNVPPRSIQNSQRAPLTIARRLAASYSQISKVLRQTSCTLGSVSREHLAWSWISIDSSQSISSPVQVLRRTAGSGSPVAFASASAVVHPSASPSCSAIFARTRGIGVVRQRVEQRRERRALGLDVRGRLHPHLGVRAAQLLERVGLGPRALLAALGGVGLGLLVGLLLAHRADPLAQRLAELGLGLRGGLHARRSPSPTSSFASVVRCGSASPASTARGTSCPPAAAAAPARGASASRRRVIGCESRSPASSKPASRASRSSTSPRGAS